MLFLFRTSIPKLIRLAFIALNSIFVPAAFSQQPCTDVNSYADAPGNLRGSTYSFIPETYSSYAFINNELGKNNNYKTSHAGKNKQAYEHKFKIACRRKRNLFAEQVVTHEEQQTPAIRNLPPRFARSSS